MPAWRGLRKLFGYGSASGVGTNGFREILRPSLNDAPAQTVKVSTGTSPAHSLVKSPRAKHPSSMSVRSLKASKAFSEATAGLNSLSAT